MGFKTNIAWTEHTFNIVWGCTPVGDDCRKCFRELISERFGFKLSGRDAPRRTFGPAHWAEPEAWNRKAEREGRPHLVFTTDMGDVFEDHPTVAQEREKLWPLIRRTPWLIWQILTKRPERIAECLPSDWGAGYPNVWLGTSVGRQKYVEQRVSALLTVPAVVHFVSVEPLLEAVDVSAYLGADRVNWVIGGGESGPAFRPMKTEWATALRDQCDAAKVPFFFKQSAGLRPETGIELEGEIRRAFPASISEATAKAAMEDKKVATKGKGDRVSKRKTSRAITVRVSDVQAEKVRWLWPGYIPLGKLTLLDGDPDKGKSIVTLDLAARVTTGRSFPDGAPCALGGVVILSAEDDPEDTIRPRLDAAEADASRVLLLKGVKVSGGLAVSPTLSDLDALEDAVVQVQATIVIVDTLPDYFGSGSLLNPQAVRAVLVPLAALAKKLDIAVILVRHFTKTGKTTMSKGAGCPAITAVSRSGLFVVKDPDDESRRILASFKHNLYAEEPTALAFRFVTEKGAGRVSWEGPVDWNAEALLAASMESPKARKARQQAAQFLQTVLQGGPLPVTEVTEAAKAQGLSKRTLERARRDAGVKSERKGGVGKKGKWHLSLPSKTAAVESATAKTSEPVKDRQPKSGGLSAPPRRHISPLPRSPLQPRVQPQVIGPR